MLYGRLPGFRLSELGEQMAERAADALAGRDITHVISSPLERAQQTAAPVAARHNLRVSIDDRIIEADNVFEGQRIGVGDGVLKNPKAWRHLYNPFTPSWGEPYVELAGRMRAAVSAARERPPAATRPCSSATSCRCGSHASTPSSAASCTTRASASARLASLTSLTFDDDKLVAITYTEPSADLVRAAGKSASQAKGA